MILSYKRLPKTELYDSAVVKLPEEKVLLETTAQPIEAALDNLHQMLLQYTMSQVGFKKQRVDAKLTDLSGSVYITSLDETEKYRVDPAKLRDMFKPTHITYGREE